MIRHARTALAISSLSVAVIKPTFFRLLMAAIGCALLNTARELAAGITTINLTTLTFGADEEDLATIRRSTKALSVRLVT